MILNNIDSMENTHQEFYKKHLGIIHQLTFTREFIFSSGKAEGVKGVDVSTGSVFRYTILP